MHAHPVIQATSANLDEGNESPGFPVAQRATAHGQPRQQLLFVNEACLARRCLVLFGADASAPHTCVDRRRHARKIFPFTIHTTENLCAAVTGRVCHARRISNAPDTLPEMESVPSICQIASAKRANWFTPDPRWTGIRTVATYRFWTRHALLLVKTRFSRPRNSRGESAICPAKWPRRCPQPPSIRGQSATAFSFSPLSNFSHG